MNIRIARDNDLEYINDIYNQAVPCQVSTADLEPVSMETRIEWFKIHEPDHYPVFVIEKDNMVIGWLSFSPYRFGRKALIYTAEISYYVHEDFQGIGIGSELLEFAIEQAPKLHFKNIFAILLDTNIGSIKLLEKYNFERWGHLPNVADIYGVECGQYYYGLRVT